MQDHPSAPRRARNARAGLAGAAIGVMAVLGATLAASTLASAEPVQLETADEEHVRAHEGCADETRPPLPPRRLAMERRSHLEGAASLFGISPEELREALRDGATLAEIAAEQGLGTEELIDAMLTSMQERLDEAVEAGHLTPEEASERLSMAAERLRAILGGERPDHGPRGWGRPGPGWEA